MCACISIFLLYQCEALGFDKAPWFCHMISFWYDRYTVTFWYDREVHGCTPQMSVLRGEAFGTWLAHGVLYLTANWAVVQFIIEYTVRRPRWERYVTEGMSSEPGYIFQALSSSFLSAMRQVALIYDVLLPCNFCLVDSRPWNETSKP